MTINEFLQKFRRVRHGMNVIRPRVICADGFTVSVQAGRGIYSIPREDADHYEAVELGYPSAADEQLTPYAETPESPTGTVYGYVPVALVDSVMEKHGGIVGVDYSNDHAGLWKEDGKDENT